jgi:hypothetical protein
LTLKDHADLAAKARWLARRPANHAIEGITQNQPAQAD